MAALLERVRYEQGRLLGRMSQLGFELRREACVNVITQDVVKSSAIEGEVLNPQQTRSSVARRLGLNVAGLRGLAPNSEGLVKVALDATQNFSHTLTEKRLRDWQLQLFPDGQSGFYKIRAGRWRNDKRGPMQVVSGPVGRERIHFQAPPASCLPDAMRLFLKAFENNSTDGVLKAGWAHLWFVTLHPFDDGNGRIARVISDLALARCEGMPFRFYSLSQQIEAERQQYYVQLEQQQRNGLDITSWLEWFLGCLGRSLTGADKILNMVLFKAQVWESLKPFPVNPRQRLVLNRMLSDDFKGHIQSSKYAKLAQCSTDTALRDIRALVLWGVLRTNPSRGRSTSYRLAALAAAND